MRAVVFAAALIAVSPIASADPIVEAPAAGRMHWQGKVAVVGLLVEARSLGVVGATRLASWPDRALGIEQGTPQAVSVAGGLVVHLLTQPWSFVVRLDAAEGTRPFLSGPALAVGDAIVDDLYAIWRPARAAQVRLGRAPVPFTRARQLGELDDPFGAPPFLVDRIVPDSRWGATFLGDLGAIAYAAGVYEDLDALEPRLRLNDPSQDGAVAFVLHTEWTPRAPMNGSNPTGRIAGARGPLPTPRTDPWFAVARLSYGFGGMARVRQDGTVRLDGSFSLQLKWRFLAGLGELVLSRDDGKALGAYGELMATPIDRLALGVRGEWDAGAGNEGEWSVGGCATWHVTRDRRNKVGLFGWLRRDVERGTRYDGLVVMLQAAI